MIKNLFRQMAGTQIASALTVMLCMFVDSILIGQFLGVDAMTAYGLSNPVLLIFAAIGSMLSAGIQVLCGKTMGSGDQEGTNIVFSSSVILVAVIGVVFLLSPIGTSLLQKLGSGNYMIARFLSSAKNTIPHKVIWTKVDDGVASPILKSVGSAVRLIIYETGMRTPKAPAIP